MRRRTSLLLASTMTVAGLTSGVTPAHATAKTNIRSESVGTAYYETDFTGSHEYMYTESPYCVPFTLNRNIRSAKNTSSTKKIYLFYGIDSGGHCIDRLAILGPGQEDSGRLFGDFSPLGKNGARYYFVTEA